MYTCPPDHSHSAHCYKIHGCNCEDCKASVKAEWKVQHDLYYKLGRNKRVDARSTRRRLQALACLGWGCPQLQQAGLGGNMHLQRIRSGQITRVTRVTEQKVKEFYDRHCFDVLRGASATRAINSAQRNGWIPPLGWDDIDKDNSPAI